ncbi:hypothetical protein Pelo_522 [Pelomyxa schiedti]|nr:hypothetical protein Pelo_522 [Pelomyxa schiedti]
MKLDSDEVCGLVSSGLSVVGCVVVIVGCVLMGRLHLVYWRTVVYTAVADLLLCFSVFLGPPIRIYELDDWVCDFDGFINNVSVFCSQLWTVFLAIILLWITIWKSVPNIKVELAWTALAWGFPTLLSCLVFVRKDGYSYANAWCWINVGKYPGLAWSLSIVWGWTTLAAALIIYVVLGVLAVKLRFQSGAWKDTQPQISIIKHKKERFVVPAFRQIILYPLIMIILTVCSQIDNGGTPWRKAVGSFVMPAQGFLNAMVFLGTAQIDKDKDKVLKRLSMDSAPKVNVAELCSLDVETDQPPLPSTTPTTATTTTNNN